MNDCLNLNILIKFNAELLAALWFQESQLLHHVALNSKILLNNITVI